VPRGEPEVLSVGSDGPRRAGALRGRGALAAAAAVGVLLGASGMRAWDARQSPSPPASASPVTSAAPSSGIDLRVSLGARTGGLDGVRQDRVILAVDVVVLNAGGAPLTLTAISVQGPGAGFVADPPGGPQTGLPVALPPGQFVDVRFGVSSDCRVAVRPLPRIGLVVRDAAGVTRQVVTRIPDLDVLWGQTLAPQECPPPSATS